MSEDNTPPRDLDDEADAFIAEAEADQLTALKVENAALKEQILRYAAESENTKRRAEREANDARAYAIQKFARDLLGVSDILDRAMAAAPADSADPAMKNFVVGIEMTGKELLGAFERTKTAQTGGFGAALGDSTLRVPERGNGVPDVLDEARWELEFMMRMQVPDGEPKAGMAFHKVHDRACTGLPLQPQDDPQPRELHPPSTAATRPARMLMSPTNSATWRLAGAS